jgi:hypothetical protein
MVSTAGSARHVAAGVGPVPGCPRSGTIKPLPAGEGRDGAA